MGNLQKISNFPLQKTWGESLILELFSYLRIASKKNLIVIAHQNNFKRIKYGKFEDQLYGY